MIVTEREARKKWCPMIRYVTDVVMRTNRQDFPKNDCCMGSYCMWWVEEKDSDDPRELETRGFCGAERG